MELTHILVVADVNRSLAWYEDILGASLYREYGGNSAVVQFLGNWLLLVSGAGRGLPLIASRLTCAVGPDRIVLEIRPKETRCR